MPDKNLPNGRGRPVLKGLSIIEQLCKQHIVACVDQSLLMPCFSLCVVVVSLGITYLQLPMYLVP